MDLLHWSSVTVTGNYVRIKIVCYWGCGLFTLIPPKIVLIHSLREWKLAHYIINQTNKQLTLADKLCDRISIKRFVPN